MALSDKITTEAAQFLRHAGVTIYEEGHEVNTVYLLLNGKVEISQGGVPLTRLETWAKIGKSQKDPDKTFILLNEIEAILEQPSHVTVTAVTDCVLLIMSREEFIERITGKEEEIEGKTEFIFNPKLSLLLFTHLALRCDQMRNDIAKHKRKIAELENNVTGLKEEVDDGHLQTSAALSLMLEKMDVEEVIENLAGDTHILNVGLLREELRQEGGGKDSDD